MLPLNFTIQDDDGWHVHLVVNEYGDVTYFNDKPFKTEAEARAAAALTGLPEETDEQAEPRAKRASQRTVATLKKGSRAARLEFLRKLLPAHGNFVAQIGDYDKFSVKQARKMSRLIKAAADAERAERAEQEEIERLDRANLVDFGPKLAVVRN